MTTVDLLVEAVEGKKSISFAYHGFDRVVSPYACGLNNANELKLLAMQTDGGSTSGVAHKLRFFTVTDILAPEMCAAPYEAASGSSLEAALKEFMKLYAKSSD